MNNITTGIGAALITLVLAGCTTEQAPPKVSQDTCSADASIKLVGQPRMADDEAMRLTNAKSVRQAGPNEPMTMDYNAQRLTIINDPATNKISSAICG